MKAENSTVFDVTIIGCGIMGLNTAWRLFEQAPQHQILILEQFPVFHNRGSSHGHSRIIRTAYSQGGFYTTMMPRAYELWNELEKKTNTELIR